VSDRFSLFSAFAGESDLLLGKVTERATFFLARKAYKPV